MKAPNCFGVLMTRALQGTGHEQDLGAYFTSGIPALIVGMLLLRFGRIVVRFSHPNGKEDTEE